MDTREAGRTGGKAKVKKGFAVMSKKARKEAASNGAKARWAKEKGKPR